MAARVLYVNHVGLCSGAEQSLLLLLRHLDRTQVSPRLACPAGELAQAARALGVDHLALPAARLHRRGPAGDWLRGWAGLAGAAAHLLRARQDTDLIHANSLTAALAALPLAALGRPLIWQVRDLRLPRAAVHLVAPRAAAILAISRAVAQHLGELGVPASRIHLLPNACDPAVVPRRDRAAVRAELGLDSAAEVIIAVGQLVPWKGHDVLLAAAERLAARRPRLRLVIVGEDLFGEHADWVAALRRQADQGVLRGRVTWTGQRRDVPDLLAAADVLALPSRGEPFGRVLLEAMAAGLPVVATVPGGPADVVTPGVTGRWVPPDDPPALASALAHLLDDPARRAVLGAAARRRLARFSPVRQAAELQTCYTTVLRALAQRDKESAVTR